LMSYKYTDDIWKTDKPGLVCEMPHSVFRIVSYDPFIAHIENFITKAERKYILDLKYSAADQPRFVLD
jgi:hypothetical protein